MISDTYLFFFSSRRRRTTLQGDWSSDVCSSDLERIGQVIAVQVRRRDHVELVGPRQHLLKGDVGNRVFDDDARTRFAVGNPAPRPAVDVHGAVVLLRDLVTPVTERAFRELHDVAFVHQGDALALVCDSVTEGAMDQPLGAEPAHGLDADADLDTRLALRRADRFELRLPRAY